jgi:amino acid transporter
MLSPEETVVEVHYKTAPQAHRLKLRLVPWEKLAALWLKTILLAIILFVSCLVLYAIGSSIQVWFLVTISIVGFIVCFLCVAITLVAFCLSLPLHIIENSINNVPLRKVAALRESLSAVLGNCTSSAICPELLDFLGWLQSAPPEHTRLLRITLTRLLPRVGEDELRQILTEERRQTLRQLLTRPDTPRDLLVVALLALGSVKDQKTVPLAYALRRKSPDVKDGVEAFLDAVRVAS